MTTVERSVEVAAPAPRVWSLVEELWRMPHLSPSTVEVRGPDRLTEVGQTFEQTVRIAGRRFHSTWTLERLVPGRCLHAEGELMRGVLYGITQAIEPIGTQRSRLTFTMTYELPFGLLGKLAGRLGAERRAIEEAEQVMAGLKALAEEGAAPRTEPTEHA